MTNVDFYILSDTTADARTAFACRLVDTILHKQYRVHIHVDDADTASLIDEQLWQFRPDSYVPHMRLDAPIEPQPPVTIGHGDEAPEPGIDVLLNLALDIPDWFSRFDRVAEIICQRQDILNAKRECWQTYKKRGYPVKSHDMRKPIISD
ncbi:DNA polymerase III subunit chi [Zymobacter sp. IVIA_12111.31 C1]|uniref:DNA polymerase III subunit chi n=1 Tax=Zymobacter sp. IVIA_12111.31 C1 TaxID=3394854 RepID=UPI0039C09AFA